MRCPCCRTEILELRGHEQAQAASEELKHLELHVCGRCGGGWIARPQLVEMLKRFRLAELSGHERMLAELAERFERTLGKPLIEEDDR